MAVLDILKYGNPILKEPCDLVKDFSKLPPIIDDMFDSMYEAEGIGLAANQVGINLKLFIVDITHTRETEDTHVFINGTVMKCSKEAEYLEEGCLSVPGVNLNINRPKEITFRYQTIDEKWHQKEFNGLFAKVIQHEMDHLNGILIVDRVTALEKMKHQKKLSALMEISKTK